MTFEEFANISAMEAAYKKTRRGKRKKAPEAIFEAHETENLMGLCQKVLHEQYYPADLDAFMIYEPKPREINAPAFRDKIVQRNLTDNVIYPALAPSIPFNATAAQTGKGQQCVCSKSICGHIFSERKPQMKKRDWNKGFHTVL